MKVRGRGEMVKMRDTINAIRKGGRSFRSNNISNPLSLQEERVKFSIVNLKNDC